MLLNLAPDHLDRHGTFEAYVEAKMNAFARQLDGRRSRSLRSTRRAGRRAACELRGGRLPTWTSSGGRLVVARRRRWSPPTRSAAGRAQPRERHGRGGRDARARHRPATPCAPACAASAGVPHRLESVAEQDGVAYVNDSKATNVASTAVALRSFAGGVHLIAGGVAKGRTSPRSRRWWQSAVARCI